MTVGSVPIRVCHASLSFISEDQRILRSMQALSSAGYEVTAVGYGHGVPFRPMDLREKLMRAFRQGPAWALPKNAVLALYWTMPEAQELYRAMLAKRPQIIHAHDAETLPAAARAASELGARLIADIHEFAPGMRSERFLWRLVYPAFTRVLDGAGLSRSDVNITVGDTLAGLLQQTYRLAERPYVIRNMPRFHQAPERRRPDGEILLHYHGILNSGRGLELLLAMLAMLPPRFRLRITGPNSQPGYDRRLTAKAAEYGVEQRFSLHDKVAARNLVAHAGEADIGVFLTPGKTQQQQCAMPNKIFEYIMAGLMVCAGPAPDILGLISKHGIGIALDDTSIPNIAARLTALTPEEIAVFQQASRKAAQSLCWEVESQKLLEIYETLTQSNRPVPAR